MGGWTLEAAEQVCIREGGGFDVLDLLTHLVDKSLVIMDESRYHMLETMRQYAREKLFDSNEDESLHNKHAEYFTAWVEQFKRDIRAGGSESRSGLVETSVDGAFMRRTLSNSDAVEIAAELGK